MEGDIGPISSWGSFLQPRYALSYRRPLGIAHPLLERVKYVGVGVWRGREKEIEATRSTKQHSVACAMMRRNGIKLWITSLNQ